MRIESIAKDNVHLPLVVLSWILTDCSDLNIRQTLVCCKLVPYNLMNNCLYNYRETFAWLKKPFSIHLRLLNC